MRHVIKSSLVACLLVVGGRQALAQSVYNADGSRSMLGPDAAGPDARPAGSTGELALSGSPDDPGGVPGTPQTDERFDLDCDPDIDVCVDPNAPQTYDDGYDPEAYQQFEGALSPYGSWSDDPSYGRVWTPSPQYVGNDFMPYSTGGDWVATNDYGFAWSSDYDWGWAPFHYGRWLYLAGCGGWSWIPGSVWGPAWVDWRYGGGYVGWAPLPPRGVIVGAPTRSLGNRTPWRFTVAGELLRRNPQYVPSHVAASVYTRTSPIRNLRTLTMGGVTTHITLGPPIATISHDLGRTIPTLSLRNSAPSVLPRRQIIAHAGIGLGARSYVNTNSQTHVPGPTHQSHPNVNTSNTTYHYNNSSQVPAYRSTAPAYRPSPTPPAYRFNNNNVAPAYRAPPPAYTAPSYSAPAYHAPAYSAPAPAYSAPAYSAPAYRAPAYHAPAYAAPVNRAPVYNAPAVAAPAYHAPAMSAPPPRPSTYSSGTQRRH